MLCLSIVTSCSDPMSEVGTDFFDEVSFQLESWDSLTMELSTVQFDSVITNYPDRLLIGSYDQEIIGLVNSESYITFGNDGFELLANHNSKKYERATVTLYYDGYSIGDTLMSQKLEVYALLDEIDTDDDGNLYSFSSFEKELDDLGVVIPLGEIEFVPRPISGDSVEIKLIDEFGISVFERFETNVTSSEFLDLLKGLVITSKESNAIVGFTGQPSLNIYYREYSDEDTGEQLMRFYPNDQSYLSNHIVCDRSSTNLSSLTVDQSLDSKDTEGVVFAQGGLGLGIRIDMPYLKDLLERDEELLIEEVYVELSIKNEIPEDIGSLISGATLYKVDKNNNVLYIYETIPEWYLDLEYVGATNYFKIDVTAFVKEQLTVNSTDNEEALLLSLPTERYQHSLDQIMIGDQANGSEIKLNIIKIKQ